MSSETPQMNLPSNWTEPEKWVWEKLSKGEIADFTTKEAKGKLSIDTKLSQEWSEKTVISRVFLRTVLLDEAYRGGFPWSGVKIIGAWIKEVLSLEDAVLSHPWWMDRCRFEAKVLLRGIRTPWTISLAGSTFEKSLNIEVAIIDGSLNMIDSRFKGHLTMNYLNVKQHLFMSKAQFLDVNLIAASVGGRVDMAGSSFTELLNMNSLEVGQDLFMNDKAQFSSVDLGGAKIGGQLNMDGSTFTGCLKMASLEVRQHLLMNNKSHFADVDLTVAKVMGQMNMDQSIFTGPLNMNGLKVGGQLNMDGSTFMGSLKMNCLEVKQSLMMRGGARFTEVNISAARVGWTLEVTGSTFTDLLNMNGLEVKQSLLAQKAHFSEVKITGAKVGGRLVMSDSIFTGSLIMEHIHIGLDLLMRNLNCPMEGERVNLIFAKILGNLAISGSQISSLDLTGTKISGEFCLCPFPPSQPIKWWPGAKLTLRNTDVGALQDHRDSWPGILDLNGFTYARLGGLDPKGENTVTNRETSWFCRWLEKQPEYSPQPYQYLSSILMSSGHRKEADEILYAGRERERKSSHGGRWLWMTLLKGTIGYGYKTWRALLWATGFVILGYIALRFWAPNIGTGTPVDEVFYSLNMLLPGVQLNIPHFVISLPPPVRYYFYFQRLMGVILGSFLIAGLSGLTKK